MSPTRTTQSTGRVPGVRPRVLRPGGVFSADEVATLLAAWHPEVVAELRGMRMWWNAAANELEGAYWEVAAALAVREYRSEEHLRKALFRGLTYRGLTFWKRSLAQDERQVIVADAFFELEASDESDDPHTRSISADFRLAVEFLAELEPIQRAVWTLICGHELSQRATAVRLGIALLEVKRHVYAVRGKLERFARVLRADRLCASRKPAIVAFACGAADERVSSVARAHLRSCRACRQAYRETIEGESALREVNRGEATARPSIAPRPTIQSRERAA